ncbi:endonuclease/exonuclease/phosphatase family protein [Mesorhizobium sp.]|uniref:endonuclease/exonuclease/phosphatase family protein n=1 Tax=Mesorhizobium sp. TaxID=1871066 RepID=UPI00338ED931
MPARQHGAVENPRSSVAQFPLAAQPQFRSDEFSARRAGGADRDAAWLHPLLFHPSRPSQPGRTRQPDPVSAPAPVELCDRGRRAVGVAEVGLPDLPCPEGFVVMGDFNMLAGSPEYVEFAGRLDHEFGMPVTADLAVDAALRLAAAGADLVTWVDPKRPGDASRHKRIDYVFTSASLAKSLKRLWVDRQAVGSDHLPVWVEMV